MLFFFFLKYLPQGRNSFGRVVRRRVDHHRHHTKTVFNYLFVRLKNVLYGLGAAAAAVDFHAALSRRVQFTRQKRSDRGRAAGKIKICVFFF